MLTFIFTNPMLLFAILIGSIFCVLVLLTIYIIAEIFLERYRFRKNLQANQNCSIFIRGNMKSWFECATVRYVNRQTGYADLITESGDNVSVLITDIYPPFIEEIEKIQSA